jgi:hypothetical protein
MPRPALGRMSRGESPPLLVGLDGHESAKGPAPDAQGPAGALEGCEAEALREKHFAGDLLSVSGASTVR